MKLRHVLIALCALALLLGGGSAAAAHRQAGPIADVVITSSEIRWLPRVPSAGFTLTIAAPGGNVERHEFGAGAVPALRIADDGGQPRPDGAYRYELRAAPLPSAATQPGAGEDGREGTVPTSLLTLEPQTGGFSVAGGAFVAPSTAPEPISAQRGGVQEAQPGAVGPLDQVTPDDLIVQGSACVGFDCVDGESFGFDTIRLKENNLRIKFDDTSASAGFPANDWQLTANDSASGGRNIFMLEDVTGVKVPFLVEAGAPTNALFIAANGKIGMRTSTPAMDIHMATTDTPAIRLEQTNGGGFTAQTWDVAGNEANFFVRDLTNGSLLPFRIRPGAPTSSIDIAASGNVGIGTASPAARLHVMGDVRIEGSLVELSDENVKHAFAPVNGADVLAKLRTLPISTWSYRQDATGTRHMGPMAQGFYAAFGLGADDRHLAPLDANGVALAAVQALDKAVSERDARIAALERENADLAARLSQLEQLVGELAKEQGN